MPSRNTTETQDLPTYAELERRLSAEWEEQLNGPAAIATANLLALKLRTSPPDPSTHRHAIDRAVEALWDNNRIDRARDLVEAWRIQVMAILARSPLIDPFEPRVRGAILTARLEHRAQNYELAFAHANVAYRRILEAAGGEDELRAELECADPNLVGELMCAVLAIGIPSGRVHLQGRPIMRAQFLDPLIRLSLSIAFASDVPPTYERMHAMVVQTLFAIAERRDTRDVDTLTKLARLERHLRPRHARGQATKRLPDLALAQHKGDVAAEEQLTPEISDDLLKAGLYRHIEVLSARGWWSEKAS